MGKKKTVQVSREALQEIVDDEPCVKDHHGYCQTHWLTDPCPMVEFREALKPKPPKPRTCKVCGSAERMKNRSPIDDHCGRPGCIPF